MRSLRLALAAPLALALGCVTTGAPHPRALINNELCTKEIDKRNLEQAEVFCDLGLQFSPQYADLWVNKGLIAYYAGRKEQAKEYFIKAIRFNQDQAQAYMNLGVLYKEEGALGRAHDNFQRALKVNPDYLEARYNLGLTFLAMDKLAESRKEMLTLLAVNPNLANAHHALGVISYKQNELQDAAASFQKAVEYNPNDPAPWNDFGAVLMELGKFKDAREAFGHCVALDPNNAQCLSNLAIAQRKAALLDPAVKEIQRTQKEENTAEALFVLAREYRKQGLVAEEENTYKKCLKLDAKYAPCHYGLFELFSQVGKKEGATVACKNFLKYGSVEEYPDQMETCEKYLSGSTR